MNNTDDKGQIKERARRSVWDFVLRLRDRGVKESEVWLWLLEISNALEKGSEHDFVNDAMKELKVLYMDTRESLDDIDRTSLFAELRVTANGFKNGWMGYPTTQVSEIKEPLAEDANLLNPIRCVVYSDVHLGIKQSSRAAFFKHLDELRGVTLVLLGDILDLWIYSNNLDDTSLAAHVAAEWNDLFMHLSEAKERDCKIYFVPGNHDAFTYFIEANNNDRWANAILEKTPLLREIKERTRDSSLLQVADIHYPYLNLQIGPSSVLFTHGHYSNWGWRLITGLEDADFPFHPVVANASVVLAHKNARTLRRINNEKDWLRRTHQIEDTAISLTNAILSSYHGVWQLGERDLIALIDRATALYFGTTSNVSNAEELAIREAFLAMRLNHERDVSDLISIRDRNVSFLGRARRGSNVTLQRVGGAVTTTQTPFSEFIHFDEFVFGHYHEPRDTSGIHDVGGYVASVQTSIHIDSKGQISRQG